LAAPEEDGWISQAEAARIRHVSPQAINKLVAKGHLTSAMIAGRRVVWRRDVESFSPRIGGRPPMKKSSAPKQQKLFGHRSP
jgi:hypothetical protein